MLKTLMMLVTGAILVVCSSASPVYAQATRTWVSGVGDDANPCSRTAPCKTFAGAISKTAAGGEINCLDPGGFGALTITKAITISCEAGTAGVLVQGTNGINVNAGASDVVVLRGLDFDGLGTGINGVKFNTGNALVIQDCSIRNFGASGGIGIAFTPSTSATMTVINTLIHHNGNGASGAGMQIGPTGSATARVALDRVRVTNNFNGIAANGSGTTGVTSVMLVQSMIVSNGSNGLATGGANTTIFVGSSVLTGNGVATSGNVLSYLNNQINGNSSDTTPSTAGGLH